MPNNGYKDKANKKATDIKRHNVSTFKISFVYVTKNKP